MRSALIAILVAGFTTGACGGGTTSPTTPSAQTMSGSRAGATSDSSGSMMGAGLSSAQMNNAQWTLTQNGGSFSGTMQCPGYMMGGTMTVSGTMSGHTGTFTMTMPSGSMMMAGCTARASGTFDMDDMMTQMHGTYTGMNSCKGPFDHGQLSFHR
jgi:hypothetical protein